MVMRGGGGAEAPWWKNPWVAGSALGVVGLGTAMWGPLGMAFSSAAVGLWAVSQSQSEARHQESLRQQQRMGLQLMQGADPEELAGILTHGSLHDASLLDFLVDLKGTTGGESSRNATRSPGEHQMEGVAPGLQFFLSHDLGVWYARLELKGDAARAFLNGPPCVFRGRGESPQDAIQMALQAASTAKKKQAIAEFAERMLEEEA
jgi:hypothetical protein